MTPAGAAPGAHGRPTLPASSDGHNVWMAVERLDAKGTVQHELLHHGLAMGGPYARHVMSIEAAPSAMASTHGSLWMVMPAVDAVRNRAEVYRVEAAFQARAGVYVYQPQSHAKFVEGLPAGCTVAGAATDGEDLYVLCAPGIPQRLSPKGWEAVAGASQSTQLLQWGERPAAVVKHQPFTVGILSDGPWREWQMALPEGAEVFPVPGAARSALLVVQPDGKATLSYVNGASLARLADLPSAHASWAVVGLDNQFAMLESTADGSVVMRLIDGVDGTFGDAAVLVRPPSTAGEWIHLPVLGMLTIAIALVALLMNHVGPLGRLPAPYGYQPLSAARRLAALALDLLPAAALMVAIGYPWRSLLTLPMLSTTAAAAVPGTLWVLAALGYCVALEAALGATPGKWLAGGALSQMEPPGAKPQLWRVLVRNVFKGMMLLVPPAAVFVAWAPGGRGVGDVLAGTAVIRRGTAAPLKPPQDSRR